MTQTTRFALGDISMAVDDVPGTMEYSAMPLVMLHGAIQTRAIWERQVEGFRSSRRVLTLDLRGHGETSLGSRRMTVEQMAADVLALLDSLEIRQAAICGVSLGGMVALELEAQSPERVSSLVLANTPTSLTAVPWLRSLVDRIDPQNLLPFAFSLFGQKHAARIGLAIASRAVGPHWVGKSARRHFVDGFASMSPDAIVATYRAIVEARPVDAASIQCPVLVVKGKDDAPSINAQMDALAASAPLARSAVVPGGHVASLDEPEAFNRLLSDFLRHHDPA